MRAFTTLLLFASFAALCAAAPCSAQRLTAAEKAAWTQRLTNLIPNSIEGIRTVQDLAALDGDDVYAVLSENWQALSSPDVKGYILSCIVQNDNSRVLDILDLGVKDPALSVQNRALQFCESYGFDTFTEDFEAYREWRQSSTGKSVGDVFKASMQSAVDRLPKMDELKRSALLNILVRCNFTATSRTSRMRRDAAIAANLPGALLPWLKVQNNLMWTAYQIVRSIRPTEEFLKTVVLPLTDARTDPAVRFQALSTVAGEQNSWATAPLLKMMIAEYPDPSAEIIGQALGQIGDPHIIPTFIAMMEQDNTPEGDRVLGNILSPLTGVTNAYVRDAAWWLAWWNRNRSRFPADVSGAALPKLALRQRPAQAPLQNTLQEPARPTLHQIAGDPKRSYWLIDPRATGNGLLFTPGRRPLRLLVRANVAGAINPALEAPPPPPLAKPPVNAAPPEPKQTDEPGLLVVLTSDGDAASAASFWYDVATKALDKKYLVAVVAAPKWSNSQQQIWLTAFDVKSVKEARFSTETLVEDVVKDVAATTAIDPGRVLLHGIGPGGTAAYAASLVDRSPFRGFYILAATFKSASLPSLDHASGRKYLIQNSKDDQAHPYWMAEAAQKMLGQKGAVVRLDPTPGYLGTQSGDAIMAQIKSSIAWFSPPAAKK